MQAEAKVCFYLGANSPTGFYSLYDQLLEPEQAETIYILKGGPGCGKSSLMRRVAQAMEEKGASVEYIACSGDPDSLFHTGKIETGQQIRRNSKLSGQSINLFPIRMFIAQGQIVQHSSPAGML